MTDRWSIAQTTQPPHHSGDTAGLTRYAISAGIIESSVQLTIV